MPKIQLCLLTSQEREKFIQIKDPLFFLEDTIEELRQRKDYWDKIQSLLPGEKFATPGRIDREIEECQSALKALRQETDVCFECLGTGASSIDRFNETDCDRCSGTGFVSLGHVRDELLSHGDKSPSDTRSEGLNFSKEELLIARREFG